MEKSVGLALLLALISHLLIAQAVSSNEIAWSAHFPNLGTFSSPRVADLNQDGVGDIILGMGRLEFEAADTAIVALNGKDGNVLWRVATNDQIFGSALLHDINQDGIPDVIIGGRSANLLAIDGATGALIWEFIKGDMKELVQKKWFNFYNPQLIPDQNGDGLDDIIISNGGDVNKLPYDENRPTGHLLVLDMATGDIIQEAPMPDGKETYHSVSVSPRGEGSDLKVVFGTGGETVGGNLYVCTLKELMEGNLSFATLLASSPDKGFIAPAVWADINKDGIADILACSVDGNVLAFDGLTFKRLWKKKIPGAEIYASFGVGNFTRKAGPDFFVTANKGMWPLFSQSFQMMFSGPKGKIKYEDYFGEFQTSSPVAFDLDGDGIDEIILSVNLVDLISENQWYHTNTISAIDFKRNKTYRLFDPLPGHNNSATPWIGDLDGDGWLDVVFCHSDNPNNTFKLDGMRVNLLKTKIPAENAPKWGAYMGSSYDGRY
ncbi:outer membrane protein assembly factor BamB family protein [Pleomorphovibrio marinus]|uniref:outer membrane protein assembly factor BamB family protein n=1 Tax=Pleomorphovibrio marinus TaxID=2164132 RepID=UPI000E0A4959|nr:PQQ-binding-like beta-propeller repeat protein [Pleomorphovibrio marinus]